MFELSVCTMIDIYKSIRSATIIDFAFTKPFYSQCVANLLKFSAVCSMTILCQQVQLLNDAWFPRFCHDFFVFVPRYECDLHHFCRDKTTILGTLACRGDAILGKCYRNKKRPRHLNRLNRLFRNFQPHPSESTMKLSSIIGEIKTAWSA